MTLLEKSTFCGVTVWGLAPVTCVNLQPKPSEQGSGTRASVGATMVPIAMSRLSEREVPLVLYWAPWLYLGLQVYCTLFNYL